MRCGSGPHSLSAAEWSCEITCSAGKRQLREDEVMVTHHLDSLVARGNTSDVYRWGKNEVIKVLRPNIPKEWATREAETTELAHAAGLPAPAVLDVTTIDGRPGIIFERIPGPSMWEQMIADPQEIPRLSSLLAELQAEVNATPAPSGIPSLIDALRSNIDAAQPLSSFERAMGHEALERQPHEAALCHFDVHPNNVLMGPTQPMIIDWFDAASGSPAADIVRSSILMRQDAAEGHLPCSSPSLIDFVHDQYIASVVRVREVDDDLLLSWEGTVLSARLAEPIVDSIRQTTYETLHALNASQITRLGSSRRGVAPE